MRRLLLSAAVAAAAFAASAPAEAVCTGTRPLEACASLGECYPRCPLDPGAEVNCYAQQPFSGICELLDVFQSGAA